MKCTGTVTRTNVLGAALSFTLSLCLFGSVARADQAAPVDPSPTAPTVESAPDSDRTGAVQLDLGLTFSRFEQQVKTEIGGVAVSPIVSETTFGLTLFGTVTLWRFIRLGAFLQVDAGSRRAGRFLGVVGGEPDISDRIGGRFSEVWFGPLLRLQYRFVFAELGWGALGRRSDQARDDLPAEGDTESALKTSARVAWLFAIGGHVPIRGRFSLTLRVEYRIRYYDRRDTTLDEDVVHGTQNLTPFIGVGVTL